MYLHRSILFLFLLTLPTLAAESANQLPLDLLQSALDKQKKEDHKGAIDDVTKALELDSSGKYHSLAYSIRSRSKKHLDDIDGAIADANKLIELDPKASNYCNRARLKAMKSDFKTAVSDCDQALKINPDDNDALLARSNIKMAGNDDTAIDDINKALNKDPKELIALFARGVFQYTHHHFQEAVADFQKITEDAPSHVRWNDPTIDCLLYLARSRAGEAAEAKKQLILLLDTRNALNGSEDWHSKTGAYLVDKLSEADLLKAADDPDKKTNTWQHAEAAFYIASKAVLEKNQTKAAEYFQKVIDGIPDPTNSPRIIAAAELKSLKPKPTP